MVVRITSENPVTHSPYPNILFTIYEVKNPTFGGKDESTAIYNGKTDENGNAYYEFEIPENYKWTYKINFDYSKMDVPTNDYYMKRAPDFQYLQRGYDNVFDIQILPYFTHIKNINCFDAYDKMRFRTKKLFSQGTPGWSFWDTLYANYFHGCEDKSYPLYKPQDIYIYEVESTKNGILSTYIDTFKAESNLDTFKIYY